MADLFGELGQRGKETAGSINRDFPTKSSNRYKTVVVRFIVGLVWGVCNVCICDGYAILYFFWVARDVRLPNRHGNNHNK